MKSRLYLNWKGYRVPTDLFRPLDPGHGAADHPYVFFEIVPTGDAKIEVMRFSTASPGLFLLPGAAGGIRAYSGLCEQLNHAGVETIGLNPRGCGSSSGTLEDLSMETLANDVIGIIEALGEPPSVLAGHAGGNRVARMVATLRPDLVKGVVLMATGGKVAGDSEARNAMRLALDSGVPEDQWREAVMLAFVAPGNAMPEELLFQEDQSPAFTRAFAEASTRLPIDVWWSGGSAPLLVLQGTEDRVAPIANGHLLEEAWPDRVKVVDIERAGHLLPFEQTARVATEIAEWVRHL